MLVIAGCVVVVGCVLAGFAMSGGAIGALIHPAEILTIGGAALGALMVMSPKKVLIDLIKGILQCFKGTPYNRASYDELFKLLYDLFRLARREGLIALEQHVSNSKESDIFKKYPRVAGNHHVAEFICGALSPIIEGTVKPEQLPLLLNTELKVIEEEHHASVCRADEDGRRLARLRHRGGRAGDRDDDGRDQRAGGRDRREGRRGAGGNVLGNSVVLRLHEPVGRRGWTRWVRPK